MRFALPLLLAFAPAAAAQSGFADVGAIRAEFAPPQAKPGQVVILRFTVAPNDGCHTYPTAASAAGQLSLNRVKPTYAPLKAGQAGPALAVVGPVVDPPGTKEVLDPAGGFKKVREYLSPATWELKVLVSPKAPAGRVAFDWAGFRIQVCSKQSCLNAHAENFPALALEVLPGPAELVPAEYADEAKAAFDAPATSPVTAAVRTADPPAPKAEEPAVARTKAHLPAAEYQARLDGLLAHLERQPVKREGGTLALLLTALFWGFVSLATPCVFPMIPITVSLFLKQSNQSAAGAVKLAAVYSLTIVAILGLSAVTLLSVFSRLSVSPVTNVLLGALFVVFALSLFGMYEIVLPNSLLRAAESRRKQGGVVGTVFGAAAFSIVAFTCVAPFLGGFAGMVSSGQYSQVELVLAGLAFATAFAAPFFVLALFPGLLKRLPKSGGWLDSVKVVMGFLEVAAALKFFRTAEIRWLGTPTYFTYDLVLAGWVVTAAACGLYLLNVYRLPHDEEKPTIGVPRLMAALLFLGFAAYLAPGLLKQPNGEGQRPRGIVFAWVDAFLLPEPGAGGGDDLPWGADLPAALDKARDDAAKSGMPRYVFVDFTGATCSNCKANEQNVFPRPRVNALLRRYALVQIYTDDVPAKFFTRPPGQSELEAEGEVNFRFQKEAFGTQQLPLYVVLEPTPAGAKVVGVYAEGLINDAEAFAAFLEGPFKK